MNVQEMQLSFLTKLRSDYHIEFDIPTYDIEFFLTEAQRIIIDEYYKIFEINEKSRKVLSNLVVNVDLTRTSVSSETSGLLPNGEYWILPDTCMYSLKEEASLNINSCDTITTNESEFIRVYVKPINLDYYSKNISNPFKKPYYDLVWRIDSSFGESDKIHMLITGGSYKVQKYHLTYLAYPEKISIFEDISCKLPNFIHQDIVDEAVRICLESNNNNKTYKN